MPTAIERETRTVPIARLKAWPGNPRAHNIPIIRESLKENGQYRPVLVQRRTNRIIAGHGLVEAAQLEGWAEIQVDLIDVDDLRAQKILAVDNRASDLGSYDEQLLLNLLQELPDVSGTGYVPADLDDLFSRLEEVKITPFQPFKGGYSETPEQLAARSTDADPVHPVRQVILVFSNLDEFQEFQQQVQRLRELYSDIVPEGTGVTPLIREAVARAVATE